MLYDFENNFLYCRLRLIRKRPELWLGKKSLQLLICYVDGCIDGYIAGKDTGDDIFLWFKEFTEYVCKICVKGNESYGVLNAIYECGYGDEEGVEYFFELLDDFYQNHGQPKETGYEKAESYLGNEIKVARFDADEIYAMSKKYVSEHIEEIFNLPQNEMREESAISSRIRLCTVKNPEKNSFICALYDSQFVNITEVLDKVNKEK